MKYNTLYIGMLLRSPDYYFKKKYILIRIISVSPLIYVFTDILSCDWHKGFISSINQFYKSYKDYIEL